MIFKENISDIYKVIFHTYYYIGYLNMQVFRPVSWEVFYLEVMWQKREVSTHILKYLNLYRRTYEWMEFYIHALFTPWCRGTWAQRLFPFKFLPVCAIEDKTCEFRPKQVSCMDMIMYVRSRFQIRKRCLHKKPRLETWDRVLGAEELAKRSQCWLGILLVPARKNHWWYLYTVRSPMKLNANCTPRLPAGTAWLIVKR